MHRPATQSLVRYASGPAAIDAKPNTKEEDKIAHQTLKVDPEHVTTSSSVHPIFGEVGTPEPERDIDMMAGVKSDMKVIQETFSLEDVPRKAVLIGLAGVTPYVATSLSTCFLAWNINHFHETGSAVGMTGHTAEQLLHLLEPIQVGYGACIISFLGAIHWGLEWAKYNGEYGYTRYAPGVIAPALAWPTTFLPVEYALISQFLAFNYLYYNDSRAARAGQAPRWYGVYRFVLTFIVGASIVITLVGRGQIAHEIGRPSSAADRVQALRSQDWTALEEEERARNAAIVSDDEEEEAEDEEEED